MQRTSDLKTKPTAGHVNSTHVVDFRKKSIEFLCSETTNLAIRIEVCNYFFLMRLANDALSDTTRLTINLQNSQFHIDEADKKFTESASACSGLESMVCELLELQKPNPEFSNNLNETQVFL